jgi:glucokinase
MTPAPNAASRTDFLVADIGGTNARFALATPGAPRLFDAASARRYRAADFASLADAARRYLDETKSAPKHAVFAIAAPATTDVIQITNNPWRIDVDATRAALSLDTLRMVNDFAAQTAALTALDRHEARALGPVPPPTVGAVHAQNFCVLGPGTGLGVGAMLVRGTHRVIIETEGGHLGFAPRDADERALLTRLAERFDRVSNERLVSGPGLAAIYAALPDALGRIHDDGTPEGVVARFETREDARAVRAVELFCELIGSVAGDAVLGFGAWDGAYIVGSLAMKLAPELERGPFRRRFEDKGRFRDALSRVPTIAVRHPDAGLLGSAAIALESRNDPAFAPGRLWRVSA